MHSKWKGYHSTNRCYLNFEKVTWSETICPGSAACWLQNPEYSGWLFAIPRIHTVLRAVCARAKKIPSNVSKLATVLYLSHAASKKQKYCENILIQFSVMLFGFRVQQHTYQLPFCKSYHLDWTDYRFCCWGQQKFFSVETQTVCLLVQSNSLYM